MFILDQQLASDVQTTGPDLASAGNFDSVDLSGRHILPFYLFIFYGIDHFTVAGSVACPLNESDPGGDIVLIETSLLFSC